MSLATVITEVRELMAANPNIKIVDADDSKDTAEYVITVAPTRRLIGLAAIMALGMGAGMPRAGRSREFLWRSRTPINVVPMPEHKPCARAKRRNRHKGGA